MATLAYHKLIGYRQPYDHDSALVYNGFNIEDNNKRRVLTRIDVNPINYKYEDSYDNLKKSIDLINGDQSFRLLQSK